MPRLLGVRYDPEQQATTAASHPLSTHFANIVFPKMPCYFEEPYNLVSVSSSKTRMHIKSVRTAGRVLHFLTTPKR